MKCHVSALLCCLLVLPLTLMTSALPRGSSEPANNSTLGYLQRVLSGVDNSMNFFRREILHVNLDAVIGTRIVEGTFKVLLRKIEESNLSDDIPTFVLNNIQALMTSARDFSNEAVPVIKQNDPGYYENIGPITDEGVYEFDYPSRTVNPSVQIWPFNPFEAMAEKGSDSCMAEIFGTRTGVTCSISDQCWVEMTRSGNNGYTLSHEILFLQLAERFGCQVEMQSMMRRHGQDLDTLHNTICGNMLAEAHKIAADGFDARHRDLFMEQAGLCGMVGFREFFNSEWAVAILSWQDKEYGCYKWDAWPLPKHKDGLPIRTKREEKRVSHGCMCHRTTVAMTALAQYVRYILEVWLQEQGLL